jgi:ATP-dependent Lon protease
MSQTPATENHPALEILALGRWRDAFEALHARTDRMLDDTRAQILFDITKDRKSIQSGIATLIEALYAVGKPSATVLALAWSMLTCDPCKPESFRLVLPELQLALDQADLNAKDHRDLRLRTWWQAAAGTYKMAKVSIFRLADAEGERWPQPTQLDEFENTTESASPPAGPTLVVSPFKQAQQLSECLQGHGRRSAAVAGGARPGKDQGCAACGVSACKRRGRSAAA